MPGDMLQPHLLLTHQHMDQHKYISKELGYFLSVRWNYSPPLLFPTRLPTLLPPFGRPLTLVLWKNSSS